MSYLDAVLVSESRRAGRAVRSALLRHRRIAERPLAIVLWQLGAEPFTAAAVAWGAHRESREMSVPCEPRNRDLAFRALLTFARSFNPWFESASPQVVVPNRGNLSLLGRLGRRLAYLPLEGPHAADPALVRLGQHLRFLAERARHPGQQLTLVLTEMLASHWTSELSELEREHLPALDAIIHPPSGKSVDEALREAEKNEIGPLPTASDDERVGELMSAFHRDRGGSSEEAVVAPLRAPVEAHYASLVDRAWPLVFRCLDRERGWREAPSVERRWEEDIEAHARHLAWVAEKGGSYRTRQTNKQAAYTLRTWEEALRLVLTEEAVDDPLRMIPYLLSGDALMGRVIEVDLNHSELGKKRAVKRPLVRVETEERCSVLAGGALFWSKTPKAPEYTVVDVSAAEGGGSIITLKHETSAAQWERPSLGEEVIFSTLHVQPAPPLKLPDNPPWTHGGEGGIESSLEEPDDAGGDSE